MPLWCFISMFNLQHNYHCMDYTINCIGIFTICSSLSIWPFLFVCIFVEIHCSDDILCECLVSEFWILKLQGIEWWMQIFWYGNDEWYDEMKLVINRDDESLLTLLDKIIICLVVKEILKMRVSTAAKSNFSLFEHYCTLSTIINNQTFSNTVH